LDFAPEAIDIETGTEIGWQDFYYAVATKRDFPVNKET